MQGRFEYGLPHARVSECYEEAGKRIMTFMKG
jgi:hypothetical protein